MIRRTRGKAGGALLLTTLLLVAACGHAPPRQAIAPAGPPVQVVRLLSLNDFHGQIVPGRMVAGRPVGSLGVLGAWLRASQEGKAGRVLLVHAGDLVGASPPASALLQDEPTISFLNRFASDACRYTGDAPPKLPTDLLLPDTDPRFLSWLDPACNVVGTIGNHELDEGRTELLRLLAGGNHPRGPFLDAAWRGARYPTLAANVVDSSTHRPILPAFVVKQVGGVQLGFIGVVTRAAAGAVESSGVAGLDFLDEVATVNQYTALLKSRGVRAVVVLIHQGGDQPPYGGLTREEATGPEGEIVGIVDRLDPEVDVVIAGHTHGFMNAWLPAKDGKRVLVTEAFSAGTAFGWMDVEVDRKTGDVVGARAAVQTAWADEPPGSVPDKSSLVIQTAAEAKVAPLVKRVICTSAVKLARAVDAAGESRLGDLVADAHRAAVPGAQIAFTNRGGLRADLSEGPLTWGDLYAAQPFGNDLVAMTLTGTQLLAVLEQQWGGVRPEIMPVSGLTYAFTATDPYGDRVSDVKVGGEPLQRGKSYRVVVNGFLAGGGDGFATFKLGTDRVRAGTDLEALVAYLKGRPQPVEAPRGGRIRALP